MLWSNYFLVFDFTDAGGFGTCFGGFGGGISFCNIRYGDPDLIVEEALFKG
jgi:hypothetical protein